jgi:hypothetical protein
VLSRLAVFPVLDESTDVEPVPSSKCQRPSRPLERVDVSDAHVVPHAPQLDPSVVVSVQVMGVMTPTMSRPFAPEPIVCENVRLFAPVAVAVASTVTPPTAAASRGCQSPEAINTAAKNAGPTQRRRFQRVLATRPSTRKSRSPVSGRPRLTIVQPPCGSLSPVDVAEAPGAPTLLGNEPSDVTPASPTDAVGSGVTSGAMGFAGPYHFTEPSCQTSCTQYETGPFQPGVPSVHENDDRVPASAPPSMRSWLSCVRGPAPLLRKT